MENRTFEKTAEMRTHVEIRKLHFIEELLKIDNEDIIKKLETILKEERIKSLEKELGQPMSMVAFNEMIDKSEADFNEGRVVTAQELKKRVRNWK